MPDSLALTGLQVRRGAVLAGAVALLMLPAGAGGGFVAQPVEPPTGSPAVTGSAPGRGAASQPAAGGRGRSI